MSDHKGKEPHVLYCDAHKGNSQAFRDGYDRTFGKKPLPHGKRYFVDNGTYFIPEGTDHTEFVWTDPKDWKAIEGNCIDGNSTRD